MYHLCLIIFQQRQLTYNKNNFFPSTRYSEFYALKTSFLTTRKQHSGTKNVSYLNSFCFVLLIVFLFIKAIFCFFYLVFLVKSHIYLCQWHSVILSYYHANRAKKYAPPSAVLHRERRFVPPLVGEFMLIWHLAIKKVTMAKKFTKN